MPVWQRSSLLLVLVCMVVVPSAALFRLALSHEFAKLVLTERGWVDMNDQAHGVWDYLGGVLLCTEAGARVADAAGRDLVALEHADRRTPVAAATPELLEVLLDYRRSP